MKLTQKKVCMLGSFAVGKTSLVKRYVEGRFDDRYLSTIGVKISRRSVKFEESPVNLIIWDLAGGDEFLRSNAGYLRGAAGGLLVCDLTRPQTLHAVEDYANQLRTINPDASIVVLGNKADLVEQRRISDENLEEISTMISDCDVFLTSAKDGLNVAEAFEKLAQCMLTKELG